MKWGTSSKRRTIKSFLRNATAFRVRGKFGKYFLKNPFTFKTTLSLLGEKNARMAFRVRMLGKGFQDHKIKISLKGENKND